MVRPTEKQISDDLWAVQKQVDKVMSNIETFETKKRELSLKKTGKQNTVGAGITTMFQASRVSPTVNTFANVVKLNDSSVRASNPNFEYGQKNLNSPMAVGTVKKNRS